MSVCMCVYRPMCMLKYALLGLNSLGWRERKQTTNKELEESGIEDENKSHGTMIISTRTLVRMIARTLANNKRQNATTTAMTTSKTTIIITKFLATKIFRKLLRLYTMTTRRVFSKTKKISGNTYRNSIYIA